MLTIIKIEANSNGCHSLQSQSDRTECWEDGWIAVPEELVAQAWACSGYCTLDIQNGVLVGLTPTERPEPEPEPEPEPSGDYVTYGELAAAIREGVNAV